MTMTILRIILITMAFLLVGFTLVKQSKKPSGFIGRIMIQIWNRTYRLLFEWSLSQIKLSPNAVVLDVGIGGGVSVQSISKYVPFGQVYGIDYSSEAIEQANRLLEANMISKAVIMQMDVMDMSFDNGMFDNIFAFQSHFHFQDLEKALQEMQRVLKVNGHVVIACEWSKAKYYLKSLARNDSMTDLMQQAGLEMICIKRYHQWIYYEAIKREM